MQLVPDTNTAMVTVWYQWKIYGKPGHRRVSSRSPLENCKFLT